MSAPWYPNQQQPGFQYPQQTGFQQAMPTGYPGGGSGFLQPQRTGFPGPAGFNPQQQQSGGVPPIPQMFSSHLHHHQPQPPPPQQQLVHNQALQQSFRQHNEALRGTTAPKVPWALSREERKNYDQIFRAWDPNTTGFISGEAATEVFSQSELDRGELAQIWYVWG